MKFTRTLVLFLLLLCAVPATANAQTRPRFANIYDAIFVEHTLPTFIEVFLSGENRRREVTCMALNVYHEARGTNQSDREGVAHVTMNRLDSGLWGRTVCAVVMARSQFSWTTFSEGRAVPRETQAWLNAQQTAYRVYSEETAEDPTEGATHFYAASMNRPPAWAARGVNKRRIGGHIYMRLRS